MRWHHQPALRCGPGYEGGQHTAHVRKVGHADQVARAVKVHQAAHPREDRHVVAAAIVGHADAIVTFNVKDFPASVLRPYGTEVQRPDEFLMNQLQLQKIPTLSAIKKMRARWTNPVRPAQELITAFELRGLPLTADLVRDAITLI